MFINYIRFLLFPLGVIYWLIISVRNLFFDRKVLRVINAGIPVISVGNISVGGSGKTPVVEMLANMISASKRIGIVSRGYRRKSRGTIIVSDGRKIMATVKEAGDEPYQLAMKFPEAIVVVGKNKVECAQKAREFGAQVVIVDDGFQYRRLERVIDLVVVPFDKILHRDWILPVGSSREPLSSLKRADIVVVSRCNSSLNADLIQKKLRKYQKPVVYVNTVIRRLKNAKTMAEIPISEVFGKNLIAFSGIGDPESFRKTLVSANLNIKKHIIFPDHHWYSKKDIKKVIKEASKIGANYVITTEKDFVRLLQYKLLLLFDFLLVAEIEQVILNGDENLNNILRIKLLNYNNVGI